MNKVFDILKQTEHWRKYQIKVLSETRREIILPVPVSEVQSRLQTAFAAPIIISKGAFFAKREYIGHVNGTFIDVQYTIRSRNGCSYDMHGQLFPHPAGSKLEMIIKNKPRTYLSMLLSFALISIFLIRQGDEASICFFVLAALLNLGAVTWQRNSADDNTAELIQKIVANKL